MAISLVEAVSTSYGAGNTVTFSSAPSQGDLIVLMSSHRSGSSTPSFPAGFTQVTGSPYENEISDSTYRQGMAVAYKVAGASEGTGYSISWGGTSSRSAGIVLRPGASEEFTFDDVSFGGSGTGGASATSQATGSTGATSGSVVEIGLGAVKTDGSNPGTYAGAWTNLTNVEDGAEAGGAFSVHVSVGWRETADTAHSETFSYTGNEHTTSIIAALAVFTLAAGDPPPSITDVDEDDTITSDQVNVEIDGTDFDTATVEIRQGSVEVAQSVDSQTATAIVFDVVFEGTSDLKHGSATLAVINEDEQEDTIAITIDAPSGHLYVDIGTPNTTADNRITAVPDIESGDQIEARGEGGGSVPTGLTLHDDGTFEFSSGNTPAAFDVRIWDVNDATWGAWATQSVAAASVVPVIMHHRRMLGMS